MQQTIGKAQLNRMSSDIRYAQARIVPADAVSRFGYDHGSLLMWDKSGKCDLLFARDGSTLRADAARVLQYANPALMEELIRGYTIAGAAGLLDEPPIPRVAEAVDQVMIDRIRDAIKAQNRSPGGLRA